MVQFGVNELLFLIIMCPYNSVCYFNRELTKMQPPLQIHVRLLVKELYKLVRHVKLQPRVH